MEHFTKTPGRERELGRPGGIDMRKKMKIKMEILLSYRQWRDLARLRSYISRLKKSGTFYRKNSPKNLHR